VLQIHLPWLTDIGRPQVKRRIPSVLTPAQVTALLNAMDAQYPAQGESAHAFPLVPCGSPAILA
jgi:hypothetical protein